MGSLLSILSRLQLIKQLIQQLVKQVVQLIKQVGELIKQLIKQVVKLTKQVAELIRQLIRQPGWAAAYYAVSKTGPGVYYEGWGAYSERFFFNIKRKCGLILKNKFM